MRKPNPRHREQSRKKTEFLLSHAVIKNQLSYILNEQLSFPWILESKLHLGICNCQVIIMWCIRGLESRQGRLHKISKIDLPIQPSWHGKLLEKTDNAEKMHRLAPLMEYNPALARGRTHAHKHTPPQPSIIKCTAEMNLVMVGGATSSFWVWKIPVGKGELFFWLFWVRVSLG